MTSKPLPATEPHREGRPLLSDARTTLVVSPNGAKVGELCAELQHRGHPTLMATRATEALYWIREIPPALVVVDLRTVGARILVPELRRQGREIVALGDDAPARQAALEAGCIESLHSSDGAEELAQHVVALMRVRDLNRVGSVTAGSLQVDLSGRRLIFEGREIAVPPLLLDLAAHLAARAGRFVSPKILLREVWGEPWADSGRVHVAVLRLRRRLGLDAQSQFINSRRGHGYGIFPEARAMESLPSGRA